jgi:hypothetical protein
MISRPLRPKQPKLHFMKGYRPQIREIRQRFIANPLKS